MKSNIKISVITITYNCKNSIEKTINSVLSQNYNNLDYVIIDGESTDGTCEIINKYRDNISTFISEKDKGISDGFNKGIEKAKGDLLLFLNAGDTFISNSVLDSAAEEWEEFKKDILFYKVKVGEHTYIPNESFNEEADKIWNVCQVPHQGTFFRKTVFERVGEFDLDYKIRMDYEMFARCLRANITYKYIPRTIVEYEVGGTSMQTKNAKAFYEEGFKVRQKYGIENNWKDYIMTCLPNWIRNLGKRLIIR